MDTPSTRLIFGAFLVALLVLVATPVGATHTSGHATEEIWAVTGQAQQAMNDVVNGFHSEIAGLNSHDEVLIAETEARDTVEAIWTDARKAVEDLVKLYPGELGQVGGDAKQQLQQKRNETRDEIAALSDAWVPAVPTTTTTTAASTTTTTTVGGSDAGVVPPRPGNGNSNVGSPPNQNGGSPPNQNGSSPPNQNGSSPSPVAEDGGVSTSSPAPAPSTSADQIGSSALRAMAQTPEQASQETRLSDALGVGGGRLTAQVSALLETVLPPAVVELVLSPLLILEILLRTVMDGGQRVVFPLALLGICAVVISLTDRWSRRRPTPSELARS